MNVTAEIISKDQLYSYLDTTYNPPLIESEADEEVFSDEWWSLRGELINALRLFGEEDDFGFADFTVGESRSTSRGISVTITSEALLSPQMISAVTHVLQEAPVAYSIYFFSEDSPLFSFFIEPYRVLIEPGEFFELPSRLGLEGKK